MRDLVLYNRLEALEEENRRLTKSVVVLTKSVKHKNEVIKELGELLTLSERRFKRLVNKLKRTLDAL